MTKHRRVRAVDLRECSRCRWTYPEEILSVLYGSGIEERDPMCGICAREVRKAIHGVDIPFRPESMAEEYELSAVEWREEHNRNGSRK